MCMCVCFILLLVCTGPAFYSFYFWYVYRDNYSIISYDNDDIRWYLLVDAYTHAHKKIQPAKAHVAKDVDAHKTTTELRERKSFLIMFLKVYCCYAAPSLCMTWPLLALPSCQCGSSLITVGTDIFRVSRRPWILLTKSEVNHVSVFLYSRTTNLVKINLHIFPYIVYRTDGENILKEKDGSAVRIMYGTE